MKNLLTFKEFLNENINEMVRSFSLSKDEKEFKGDFKNIKNSASDFLDFLKKERYTWSDTSFMYFPNFVWAGGKQVFGPSIGILIGSDTIAIRPIGTDKVIKVGDGILQRLIQNGQIESYAMKF
jgi:hypothetical protein